MNLKEWCIKNNKNEILDEWDHEKNTNISVDNISYASHQIAYWKCDKNHSYKQIVKSKTIGKHGCPVCSNKQLLIGYNDLKTKYPKLDKEWDYEKNYPNKPENYFPNSSEKVWWICKNNHRYLKSPNARVSKNGGCPYCAGQSVMVGYNDLKTLFPEIAKEWDYDLNSKKPEDYTSGAGYRAHWKCNRGHKWIVPISSRTADNTGCPKCKKEIRTSFPEQAISFYISRYYPTAKGRTNINGTEVDILIEDKKIAIEYDGVYWHKNKLNKDLRKNRIVQDAGYRLIRIREKGLETTGLEDEITINNPQNINELRECLLTLFSKIGNKNVDIDIKRDNEDIYNRYISVQKENSIAIKHKGALINWDYDKNKIKPEYVSSFSRMRVHWKCHDCGYEWSSIAQSLNRRNAEIYCPKCDKALKMRRIKNVTTNTIYSNIHEAARSCNGSEKAIYRACLGERDTAHGMIWTYADNIKYKKDKMCKRIKNLTTGTIYSNMHDAAKSCNGDEKVIYRACKGRRKKAYGFQWEYLNK